MASNTVLCNQFQAVPAQCKTNMGGVKRAWITTWDQFAFTTDATGLTTAIFSGATAIYEIIPARASSSFNQEQVIDNTNTMYKQTVELHIPNYKAYIRNLIWSLAQTPGIVTINQTRNDQFFLFGSENGLQFGSKVASGVAEGDKKETIMTFEGIEAYPALEIDPSVMTPYII